MGQNKLGNPPNMSLFSTGKYSTLQIPAANTERRMVIPDGSWEKCRKCSQTLYADRLEDNLQVCWFCGCHLQMTPEQRINMLTDPDSFTEILAEMRSEDPLHFVDLKAYPARLADSEQKTGKGDAVVCGTATLNGREFALGIMDFRFMGASMGSVVGEKITRLT